MENCIRYEFGAIWFLFAKEVIVRACLHYILSIISSLPYSDSKSKKTK